MIYDAKKTKTSANWWQRPEKNVIIYTNFEIEAIRNINYCELLYNFVNDNLDLSLNYN